MAVAEKEMEKAHEKYHLALQKVDFMEIDRNSEEFEDAERHHKIANLLEQQLKEMIEGAKQQVKEQLQSVGLEAASLMQQTLKAQHEKYIDKYANKTSGEVTPMSLIQFVEGNETHVEAESPAPSSMLETGVEYPVKASLNATEKAQVKSEKAMMATEIQRVYYINDADKSRNDFMQKQMTKASLGIHAKDIPFERFRATPASQVQDKHEKADVHRACCYSDPGDHYQGNQAYLVKPSAVPKIMKALKKRPVADFDKVILMAPAGKEQDLNTYALGDP